MVAVLADGHLQPGEASSNRPESFGNKPSHFCWLPCYLAWTTYTHSVIFNLRGGPGSVFKSDDFMVTLYPRTVGVASLIWLAASQGGLRYTLGFKFHTSNMGKQIRSKSLFSSQSPTFLSLSLSLWGDLDQALSESRVECWRREGTGTLSNRPTLKQAHSPLWAERTSLKIHMLEP